MAEAKKVTKTKISKEPKETKAKQIKHAEVVAETVPVEAAPESKLKIEEVTAKAGKRSAKALKAEEEKQTKEERKAQADKTEATKPRPKPRSRAERAGKKYQAAYKLIDPARDYTLSEALGLVLKTNPAKFDAAVELHINLGVDPKQADQNIRGTVVMPAGTGKTARIAVLAEAAEAAKAKQAGADITDADKLLADLDKEEIDFDVLIAAPNMMAKLGKYARLLGPRGLMPNPKSGTVAADVATAVAEAKSGKVEFRVDQSGIVHLAVGKTSFTADQLLQNTEAILSSIRAAKPGSLKNVYIKSIYVTSTMGPSVKVTVSGT